MNVFSKEISGWRQIISEEYVLKVFNREVAEKVHMNHGAAHCTTEDEQSITFHIPEGELWLY
jgi:hypothetical protein